MRASMFLGSMARGSWNFTLEGNDSRIAAWLLSRHLSQHWVAMLFSGVMGVFGEAGSPTGRGHIVDIEKHYTAEVDI